MAEMTEAELLQKNEELHRRQAQVAALKASGEPKAASVGEIIGGGAVAGSDNFKEKLAGLVRRIESDGPREPDTERDEIKKLTAEAAEEKRLKDSGVPGRYMAETFDTYKPRSDEEAKNLAAVRKFAEDSRRGYAGFLVMLGGNGTGKSHLGNACIHELEGLYVDIPTLEIEVECSRDFSAPENKMQVLNKYVCAPFLVIDEIGRTTSPAVERGILYYILNKRYNLRKDTVLITNYTAKELDDNLGKAIMDRIAEKRVRVEFTGQSYRRGNR